MTCTGSIDIWKKIASRQKYIFLESLTVPTVIYKNLYADLTQPAGRPDPRTSLLIVY